MVRRWAQAAEMTTNLIADQTPTRFAFPPYRPRPIPPDHRRPRLLKNPYMMASAGATPTKAKVSSWLLRSLSIPDSAWLISTCEPR